MHPVQPFKSAVLDLAVTVLAYKRILNRQSLARVTGDASPVSRARELSKLKSPAAAAAVASPKTATADAPPTAAAAAAAAATDAAADKPILRPNDLANTVFDGVQPQQEFLALLASRRAGKHDKEPNGPRSPDPRALKPIASACCMLRWCCADLPCSTVSTRVGKRGRSTVNFPQ